MDINSILKKCVGNKVGITFYASEEGKLREIEGILLNVTEQVITLEMYDHFGQKDLYYLNRHSCVLHAVVDEGKRK